MSEPTRREFRDRRLTKQEAERDTEVRRQVMQEFPPADPKLIDSTPGTLSQTLRSAIAASNESLAVLATKTGLRVELLERFVKGDRDIRISTADRLAAVLGIKAVSAS